MGRLTANAGFLHALLSIDPFDGYHFFLPSRSLLAAQAETLTAWCGRKFVADKVLLRDRLDLAAALAGRDYAVFHLSDCIVSPAHLAGLRNQRAKNLFPITSVTHSLSYAQYPQALFKQLSRATSPRDAVVCTSRAARACLKASFDLLRERYGLGPEFARPGLPVIPLGIDPAPFGRLEGPPRTQARLRFGMDPGETVLLYLGRLSPFSKMDPLPLLRAMGRLPGLGVPLGGLRLVLSGWIEDDERDIFATCRALAANLGLRLDVLARPSEADKAQLYGLADVFVSPVDNYQETFGLSVLEAMASGLPVAASDFDGYRDLVLHGETGLLAPTLACADTADLDAQGPLVGEAFVQMGLAQRLVVDVKALAESLATLLRDPDQARSMGRAGRARVAASFTWRAVLHRYLDLWRELALRPVDESLLRASGLEQHPSFTRQFAAHPTVAGAAGVGLVRATAVGEAVARGRDFPVIYEALCLSIRAECVRAACVLARKPVSFESLCAKLSSAFPGLDPLAAQAQAAFALKQDLLERA